MGRCSALPALRVTVLTLRAHLSHSDQRPFGKGKRCHNKILLLRSSNTAKRSMRSTKQLVALLNERAGHSLDIRALKPEAKMGLFDPKREEEIFTKVCSYNEGPLYNENLREIYTAILKVMKEVPNRD